jgi:hypothetical protein
MELTPRCVVCMSPAPNHVYGNRHYCEQHFSTFYEDLQFVWRTSIVTFGVFITSVILLAVGSLLLADNSTVVMRWAVSLLIAVVPSLAWFTLLYRASSRSNRELSSLIPILAGVAILLAAAVVHPFQLGLLDLDTWLSRSTTGIRLLGLILLKGFPNAFLLYISILFITWRSSAFVRRIDGILFTLAMAFAYSSTLNVLYVLDHSALSVVSGNFRLVTQQSAIVASSLVVGYYLGHNRFQDMPPYYLSVGVGLAAILNGLLLYAGTELDATGLGIQQSGFSPWPGLVVSLVALAVIFAIVRGLIMRQNGLINARLNRSP